MDRLTSLTVFAQVAESGGFSAAARRLNMSTTMVSNHVQALEDRLGARLLNRTTRRVSLTDVGRAYYERSRRILADLEEADQAAGLLQSTVRGVLRLFVATHPTDRAVVAEFAVVLARCSDELSVEDQVPQISKDRCDVNFIRRWDCHALQPSLVR